MLNISTSNLKANAENFKVAVGGVAPIITQTDLRLEAVMVNGQQVYELKVLEAAGNGDRPLENKLKSNHKFAITHIALNISRQVDGSEANSPLMTFPDASQIGVANEAVSLEAVYQASIIVKTGNNDRTAKILTHHMRYVPLQGFQTPAASGQTLAEYGGYGGSINERGYMELAQPIILNAEEDNRIFLTLGKGNHANLAAAAVNTKNIAVVLLHGLYYSGDANVLGLTC